MERQSSIATIPAFQELLKSYSGAVAWAVEREGIHTRVNLVPAAFTRNTRGPFQVHLVLYTAERPEGIPWVSRKTEFDRDLRIDLDEVFGPVFPGGFEGYLEIVATSPRQELRSQHYNEMWLDYYSDDGRVHVVLPTIQFYGSVKRTLGGQSQLWPGLVKTEDICPWLNMINPYSEAVDFHLTAIAPDGSRTVGPTIRQPPKTQCRYRIEDQIAGLLSHLAPHHGVGTLLISSNHKAVCYFMVENIRTGTISGGDHLAWFYGEEF
jgi:hypothetical protein